MRRLAPSLVITVSALGVACSEPRTRKASPPPPAGEPITGGLDFRELELLNPRHERGTILVADQRCYVQLPYEGTPSVGEAPPIKHVDCPIELDDPTWDACRGGQLYARKGDGDGCICVREGNPPPPPMSAPCPKR